MKRTMYEAARHTPKDEAGGSNPFKRASGKLPHSSRTPHFVGCVFFFACTGTNIFFVKASHQAKPGGNSCSVFRLLLVSSLTFMAGYLLQEKAK